MWANPQFPADFVTFSHLLKKSSRKNFIFCVVKINILWHITKKLYIYISKNTVRRQIIEEHSIKGAPSDVRSFLANQSPLNLMKNAFHFTLKPLFVLKIFKFLS